MRSILVRFPTGEDQDAALLASGDLTDWRERVIVKFRMLRKRALRLTMQVGLLDDFEFTNATLAVNP